MQLTLRRIKKTEKEIYSTFPIKLLIFGISYKLELLIIDNRGNKYWGEARSYGYGDTRFIREVLADEVIPIGFTYVIEMVVKMPAMAPITSMKLIRKTVQQYEEIPLNFKKIVSLDFTTLPVPAEVFISICDANLTFWGNWIIV